MMSSPTLFFFFADICVTLEAVIIAGSVKESGCNNILHLRVVIKKNGFQMQSWHFRILSDMTHFVFHPVMEAKFVSKLLQEWVHRTHQTAKQAY